jgi:hypothetical protein
MKGTCGAVLRHVLLGVVLTASTLIVSGSNAGAASITMNEVSSAKPLCGVVVNPSVRVSSKDTCVVHILLGANVRFKLGSGFRWGNPVSSSRAVVVTTMSRDSIGVDAATLHAAKIGSATVQATGIEYCKPDVACPDLALLWRLNVIVVKKLTS